MFVLMTHLNGVVKDTFHEIHKFKCTQISFPMPTEYISSVTFKLPHTIICWSAGTCKITGPCFETHYTVH